MASIEAVEDTSPIPLFLQNLRDRFRSSIRIEDVEDEPRIVRYLNRISDREFAAEKTKYENEEPHARDRNWKAFVRVAVIFQCTPPGRKAEIYEHGRP